MLIDEANYAYINKNTTTAEFFYLKNEYETVNELFSFFFNHSLQPAVCSRMYKWNCLRYRFFLYVKNYMIKS